MDVPEQRAREVVSGMHGACEAGCQCGLCDAARGTLLDRVAAALRAAVAAERERCARVCEERAAENEANASKAEREGRLHPADVMEAIAFVLREQAARLRDPAAPTPILADPARAERARIAARLRARADALMVREDVSPATAYHAADVLRAEAAALTEGT